MKILDDNGLTVELSNERIKELYEQSKPKDWETLFYALEWELKNAKRVRLLMELQQFAKEHNEGEIDWGNPFAPKYYICFNHQIKKILIENYFNSEGLPGVYFTRREIAQKAIDHFGDRLHLLREWEV